MSYDKPDYDRSEQRPSARGGIGGGLLSLLFRSPKLLGAIAIVVVGLVTYYLNTEKKVNPFTGEPVRVVLSPEQEVALGLQSEPEMLQQFGGEVSDPRKRDLVNRIGAKLLAAKEEMMQHRGMDDFDYKFRFHVLRDTQTINAFALPGGPVFITDALLSKLKNEDAVAGVIGHEIGHVLAWHSNKQMAKNSLLQSYATAAAVATSDGGGGGGQAVGQFVGQLLVTRYGREDESEADRIGVQLLMVAGYQPEALLEVMDVLEEASKGAARGPEWLSSHPNPPHRKVDIKEFIQFFRKDKFGIWK